MKYFFSFFFFLTTYFLFVFPINAQWSKYAENPVLKITSNTWYSIHAASPSVIYDENTFKMWFQGHDGSAFKIGFAQSSDGINWNVSLQPQITVSSPGLANGDEVVEPMVIKNSNTYQMWFKEYISGENRIRYATSSDGNTWTINPQPVFTKSLESWESSGPTNPSIIFENNEYKMWYIATGNTPWKLGYATSSDGISWTRHVDNPLNIPTLGFVGSPTVIKINGLYHMWYHTGSGLNTDIYHVVSNDGIQWACDGSCSVLHIENGAFDSQGITAPTVFEQNGKLYLWYGGSNGPNWQIGLATFNLPVTPSPTNIPFPSPTSTPMPTPTPYPQYPIIVIPGFMASWNKEAILHNKPVKQSEWKLPYFIKEYDGVLQTLKNIGFIENENLLVFNFDWRKNIDSIADDFQSYLQTNIWSKNQNAKINILGHSLGGLVGRIWAQKYGQNSLNTLLTVGTPHKGTAHVYKPLEGGEIDQTNNQLWLAEKTLLILNKDSFETDRDTIHSSFPILKDLFPTFNFLKRDNNFVSVDSMSIKNDTLNIYNQSQQILYPYLQSIVGEKWNTLLGFTISNRTLLDQLLNLYPDGRPNAELTDIGDYIVLSSSSKMGNNSRILNKDHGEIIYKKEGIKEILNSFHIPYEDDQITEGQGTVISPSLIFFMKSPAEMEVSFQNNIYSEQEGIIFIPNAETGNYQLNVIGKEVGRYSVVIGQVGKKSDQWNTIEGKITQNNPSDQIDSYTIHFNAKEPIFPLLDSQVLFKELILYLTDLHNPNFIKSINSIHKAQEYFINNKKSKLQDELNSIHRELFQVFQKEKIMESEKKILNAIEKLEYLYQQSLGDYNKKSSNLKLKFDLFFYEKRFEILQKTLLARKNKKNHPLILQTINEKIKLTEENVSTNKKYSEILLRSIRELLEGLPRT